MSLHIPRCEHTSVTIPECCCHSCQRAMVARYLGGGRQPAEAPSADARRDMGFSPRRVVHTNGAARRS